MEPEYKPVEVMPVSLLVEGRPCVIVGAGRIAQRKLGHLLDAGAHVTLVSPSPPAEIETLEAAGRIDLRRRPFVEDDVAGAFLVFAATDDGAINAAVRAACRARGILCCAVDRNWRDGDFVTPAIVRRDEVSVAVSTAGRSCRKSRLIKASIARHLDMVDSADLLVMGTSHAMLPVDEREPFHLAGERLERMGRMLMQVWGLHEFMILNTCNRIEVHAVMSDHDETRELMARLLGFDALAPADFYVLRGMAAFRHTAGLLAGLLSQTPGENHIVAQVKEASADAVDRGWGGPMLQGWLSAALHVSKHIRETTRPMLQAAEIEDLCRDYLAAECADERDGTLVVVGTGVMGRGVLERLLRQFPRAKAVWCYHQNRPSLKDADFQGRVRLCDLNGLRDALGSARIIVCATSSPGHVLHAAHAPFMDQEHAVTIVDLAMPRNVAPELDGISAAIRVVDLDDLKHWYRRMAADMTGIMERAVGLADEHRAMYEKLTESFQGRNAEPSGMGPC